MLSQNLNPSLFLSKVIITDSDGGMTVAVEEYLPRTVHLHCLWHVMKNVRKHCQAALGSKAHRFFKLIYAAAFATTEDVSNSGRGHETHPRLAVP